MENLALGVPLGLAAAVGAVLVAVWGGLDLLLDGAALGRGEVEVILAATLGTGFGTWARGAL